MEHIINKLVSFASILEAKTRAQAVASSSMPFIYPHIALMPDAHLGLGATVGSVIPTLGAIMPAAVGVDIGCGMRAVETQWTLEEFVEGRSLKDLRIGIENAIPLSAGKYNTKMTPSAEKRVQTLELRAFHAGGNFDPGSYAPNWSKQLGSLGSGNHFIEVSTDETHQVWLFLHSGSRGVGNKIAQKHIKVARQQCEKRWIKLPDPDLAYLVEGDNEFWTYIQELRWAQQFALENRAEMMDRVCEQVSEWFGADVQRLVDIDCHHNYTEQEEHFGKQVWVSRKGAINASQATFGLIPGSMGAASYVVSGKGNPWSLNSAPHGAGRNYSRAAAKKTFTMDQLRENMKGIEWSGSDAFLDEIPAAYKPIDVVMEDAFDLVAVVRELQQLINVKGD